MKDGGSSPSSSFETPVIIKTNDTSPIGKHYKVVNPINTPVDNTPVDKDVVGKVIMNLGGVYQLEYSDGNKYTHYLRELEPTTEPCTPHKLSRPEVPSSEEPLKVGDHVEIMEAWGSNKVGAVGIITTNPFPAHNGKRMFVGLDFNGNNGWDGYTTSLRKTDKPVTNADGSVPGDSTSSKGDGSSQDFKVGDFVEYLGNSVACSGTQGKIMKKDGDMLHVAFFGGTMHVASKSYWRKI